MEDEIKKIGGGLQPTPDDPRDFNFGQVFGLIPIEQVPNTDFWVSKPLRIYDQRSTDMCTAYAVVAVSEDQENVGLSPFYQFAKTKEISGDPEAWGADLRSACKSAQKFGSAESKDVEGAEIYKQDSPQSNTDWRNHFATGTYKEYLPDIDQKAKNHAKQSYFKIEGQYSVFDNLRAALWQNRATQRSIFTGCTWREGWTYDPGGIVPKEESRPLFGHAFKIFGQVYKNGELHLVAQLSNGEQIGERGVFYFPKEVVNRDFNFGAYMFVDMPVEEAKFLVENKLTVRTSWFEKFLINLRNNVCGQYAFK